MQAAAAAAAVTTAPTDANPYQVTEPIPNVAEKPQQPTRETWHCHLCQMKEKYDYKGSRPPFAKHLTLLEDCYVMKDPFSPANRGEVIILGADCSLCGKSVCVECSFYFSRRFCKSCALSNVEQFPRRLQEKIRRDNAEQDEDEEV